MNLLHLCSTLVAPPCSTFAPPLRHLCSTFAPPWVQNLLHLLHLLHLLYRWSGGARCSSGV